ncbi:MAG: hypothetical protein KGL46_12200 [Hyphomicrobiales bacterium]|nr:hypothetical protein [Hyphomicrobiales bacterium]
MARRRAQYEVEITEGAVRVRHGERVASVQVSAGDEDADFVVRLDELSHWDAPHQDEDIEIEELHRILLAIEEQCERHGLNVAFE